MEEEMEDLRLAALARARLQTFNPDEALSHDISKNLLAQSQR